MRRLNVAFAMLLAVFFFACSKQDNPAQDTDLFIPGAFTPNGDSINDLFIVKGENISAYKIEIFDDSKTVIYSNNDITQGWDGTYKGQPLPSDNYFWVIEYKKNTEQRKRNGYVQLLR